MSTSHDAHDPLTPARVDPLARLKLDGKVAIVTGGTRGIGLSIATTLARAGARVAISSRKPEHVDAAVLALQAEGHSVVGFPANMGKAADAHEVAARTVEHFDGIDIIVNNAATNPIFGPLQHATDEAFDKIFAVNVKGPLELCRTAHAVMVERGGGAIVNIASIGGVTPEAGLGLYSMSKAALVSLTKVMAQEWGADGIRANVICPGLIKTKFSQALWQDAQITDKVLGHQPIPRIGVPDDVAGLALFLASDAASYCTGGVYMVDGGYLS
ncbi:MAG: SDR family NAD(P)-dependent oxidoreductase [Gemmatimonas sp.]|jgi:dehydrogenase/reductase SDR family protein 4|uniref:SDR family NAD(P)-dependent oxidoreductase n=1 Tax=Gemmatimonas sp. TaxID=1962908 RepID=UPI00391F6DFC|nr:SDR family oxidoreductase [Gemmatimonadota bacterium]